MSQSKLYIILVALLRILAENETDHGLISRSDEEKSEDVEISIGRAITSAKTVHSEADSEFVTEISRTKQIYIMGRWSEPRTQYGYFTLLVLLPIGILDCHDGVRVIVEEGWLVRLTFVRKKTDYRSPLSSR